MLLADAIRKMDRLEQIVILFRRRPEGVGTAEISRLLGVSQRTARRYVKELSEHGRLPVYRQGRVWRLEEGGHTDRLRSQLNLDEALSLYLAARMLSASSDGHDPQRVASLLQLAAILPDTIGEHVQKAGAVSRKGLAPEYLKLLEGLTRNGDEVVEVKLRLSRRAVHPVKESDWPGLVAAEEDREGRCTLAFRVNHVPGIKSWIRAWGPECEVLAPEELRGEIAEEMEAAVALYADPGE